jgi:hypothetical protein
MLDLFHVPVVEPYAISEPFSTAGKVNLNYVIAPFGYAAGDAGTNPNTRIPRSYLRRDTALRGVLRSVWMMAVPSSESEMAHQEQVQSGRYFRFPIECSRDGPVSLCIGSLRHRPVSQVNRGRPSCAAADKLVHLLDDTWSDWG